MGPIGHTVVSVGIGAITWASTGSALALPVAIGAGVLVDIDHVTDFFDTRDRGRWRHMVRPLHAWEYLLAALVALLAFSQHSLLMAATLAYLGHLTLDQLANRVHPLGYFILFRASHGFRRRKLTPHIFEASYRAFQGPVPLWGRLEPGLWRMVTRWRRDSSSG